MAEERNAKRHAPSDEQIGDLSSADVRASGGGSGVWTLPTEADPDSGHLYCARRTPQHLKRKKRKRPDAHCLQVPPQTKRAP
jgi:hypothetical protein